jgi:uncharacterized protein involved in cysteine biosynthesis
VLRELVAGVTDGLRGAAYLARHRSSWKLVLAPAIVVALVGAVTLGWLVAVLGAIGLVGWSSLGIASTTVIVTFASLVSGPFNEMLSEAIEERETGVRPPEFSFARFLYEVAIGILHAARRGAGYVVVLVGLLAIGHFMPTLAAIGSAWVTARYASYGAYDAILARRHWSYRDKMRYLRDRRWRTIGLGGLVALMLLVPGVNIIGLAIGAAAATLRVVDDDRRAAQGARVA